MCIIIDTLISSCILCLVMMVIREGVVCHTVLHTRRHTRVQQPATGISLAAVKFAEDTESITPQRSTCVADLV
jgi:hypothetical protein